MKSWKPKVLMLLVSGGVLLQSGCYGLWNNIWVGFGEGIGAIPANFVANALIVPLLNSLGLTTT